MPSIFDQFWKRRGAEWSCEDHGLLTVRIKDIEGNAGAPRISEETADRRFSIIEIEGNAVAPMLSEETADLRIAICPVADERNNTGALKRIFGGLCIDPDLVVDFASETPVRCKVDEN